MVQKSKVQEMFPVSRNIFWRGTYTHYMKSWLFLALIAGLIAYVIGYASFDFKYIFWIVIGLVIVIAVATKFLADGFVDSYYFDITDDRITVTWRDAREYSVLSMPISDIKHVSVARRWLEEMYYVKISPHRGIASVVIEGFDEQTAGAVKAYIIEKMGKVAEANHLPGRKSKVQEMFPFDQNKFWYSTFLAHSTLCIYPLLILGPILLSEGPLSMLDIVSIFGAIIAFVGLLIMAYFLANRFVNNYYFDITDELIFISYPDFIGTYSVAVPFSPIQEVSVGSHKLTGAYHVKIVTHEAIFRGHKGRYYNCFEWGCFDEKTALALKEYIEQKMQKAGASLK